MSMRRTAFLAVFLVVLPQCNAQGKAEFEVASIKPAPLQPIGRASVSTSSDRSAGTLTYSNVNLRDVIERAFKVQPYQISGPEWMNDIRFDIAARFTPGSTAEQLELMLQTLLAERFSLKFHRESKELPIYALVVAKSGLKLKPSEESGNSSSNSNGHNIHLSANVTLARFSEYLSARADRPVMDHTGLPGSYEIVLDYAAEDSLATTNDGILPSLFTAIQEQLGLKVEPAKGSATFLVVDTAEGVPTEN